MDRKTITQNFELIHKFNLKEGWIISDDYLAPRNVDAWLLYVGARTL